MRPKLALRNVKARYGAMTLFANDTGAVARSLLLYREWAQREIEFIIQLFEPEATVLDVGAYIGTHTLAFAHRVGVSGLVLSFEAQPRSFELLERNVATNHLSQVRLHHAAVSNVEGTIEFTPIDPSRKESFGSASLAAILRANRDARPAGKATVTATTIDALELGRCDFIKIDVEDSEDLVLKGATHTIDRCRPIIYTECNSVDAGIQIRKMLRNHGYGLRLHLVLAFNPKNFAGEQQNIFGVAREAAILGMPPGRQLPDMQNGPGDMLLPLETIDDLVLGLLNKPQYVGEVLAKTAAAQFTKPILVVRLEDQKMSEGNDSQRAAADQLQATQSTLEWATGRLQTTQSALEQAQAIAEERSQEIARLLGQLKETQAALQNAHDLAATRQAQVADLQARLEESQIELQAAKAYAAEQQQAAGAELAKSSAALLQASLARRSADAALSALREHEFERERAVDALARSEAIASVYKAELEQVQGSLRKRILELESAVQSGLAELSLARSRTQDLEGALKQSWIAMAQRSVMAAELGNRVFKLGSLASTKVRSKIGGFARRILAKVPRIVYQRGSN